VVESLPETFTLEGNYPNPFNVDNNVLKYFLCQNDTARFRALVRNVGTLDVTGYSVQWVVRDAGGVIVFTTTGSYGALAVGGEVTVTAPDVWSASGLGEFIVTATVTATGDVTPANDSRMLEQQVDNPALAHLLDYDIPNFQVNLSFGANGGRAMKFEPCSYPVLITHIEVQITSAAGNALMRVYGDNGSGNPGAVLFSGTFALIVGTNTIVVDSIPIASGAFFVTYQYADATTPTIPMDAEPSAGSNLTMPAMYLTNDGGATWTVTTGGDHPLRAMVMPTGAIVRDIRVDWMIFAGFFVPTNTSTQHQVQVSNRGTASDTFNVSLTIEDTTFARTVLFTQTLPVVGLAPGDSIVLLFDSYNYATPGERLITAQAIVPGDATPADNTLMAETQVCVYPSELSYDDGTIENGWAFTTAGNFWGARFDPPIYPCLLTGIMVNFQEVPAGFDDARIQVIDDNGTTLLFNTLDTEVEPGWNTYGVVPPVLVMDSYFYAGTEWVTAYPDCPFIGTDTDPPISYMARQRISGVWYYDVEEAGVRVTLCAPRIQNLVIRKTSGTDNIDINLRWSFPGISAETYYFIYASDSPTATYALVDSVLHPPQ